MRSFRLLLPLKPKFTESRSCTSPTRGMPEIRSLAPRQPLAAVSLQQLISRNYSYATNSISTSQSSSNKLLERVSSNYLTAKINTRSYAKDPDLPKESYFNHFNIKRFLRMKAIECSETHACIKVDLPIHLLNETLQQEYDPKDLRASTVHINKRTGNFVIPIHGVYGIWQDFEHLINTWVRNRNLKRQSLKSPYPVLKTIHKSSDYGVLLKEDTRVYNRCTPIHKLSEHEFDQLLSNFKLHRTHFEAKDFDNVEARVSDELDQIIVPIRYSNGSLVGYRKLAIEEDELMEGNLQDSVKQSILPFPHGFHKARFGEGSACILVGSILDSIVLSSRTNIPVITLPDSGNLYPDHIPFLDQFETIFIWLNNDIQGSQNAKLFAQKIGEKKCRLVQSSYPNPTQSLHKKMNVKDVLSKSSSIYHESLTTFEKLRDDVYLEFVQSEEMLGVKWQRFDALNNVLGGFRRGEVTIFSGRTGSGKTTFLSEYSLDLCMQGVNTLWCSFEVRNTRLLRVMMKQFSLVNIEEDINVFDSVADKFTKLPLYLTDFHGSQELFRVVDAMSHAVYVHDITHVIVDNMQFMLGTTGSGSFDRFQTQDKAIETFRRFATSHNCHVTLVIHPRKENDDHLTTNSIFGGAKATQEADNVFLLQEEKNEDSFWKRKFIEIVKNRYVGNLGRVPLRFCKPINTLSWKAFDIHKSNTNYNDINEIGKSSVSGGELSGGKKSKSKQGNYLEDIRNSPFKEKGNIIHRQKENETIITSTDHSDEH